MTDVSIIRQARLAQDSLRAKGLNVEAEAVQRLIISRATSGTLNKVLHTDLARLRDLLRRTYDAMSRREPDGISDADWDQITKDIEKEVGHG